MSANSLNPIALRPEDAAKLLTKVSGEQITVAQLQLDVASGAPANRDGTLNLVHYAASAGP